MDYPHNKTIRNLFNQAKKKAWAQLQTDPDVLRLVDSRQKAKAWAKLQSDVNVIRLIEAARKEQVAENLRVDDPVESRTQYEEANQLLKMTNR